MKNIIFILFIICVTCFSCKKETVDPDEWSIELPKTKIPQELNQWAIVKYSLPKLRLEPIQKSKILNYLPLASIIKIIKKEKELKTFDNKNDYWYYVDYEGEKGWIFGSFIEIFNTYEEAEKRSGAILIGNS